MSLVVLKLQKVSNVEGLDKMPTAMGVKLMLNKDKHDTTPAADPEVKLEKHDTKITKS